jgi:hypothetical protein
MEKKEALRTSRSNLFKRMGGIEAMYAAIAVLTYEGHLVLEMDRGAGGTRETRKKWLTTSLKWAKDRGWLRDTEDLLEVTATAEEIQLTTREARKPREGKGDLKIMDVGEGWGSIGIAVSRMPEGCSTIGVDRERFLDQGDLHGTITSRVNLDLCSEGSKNVLRRAAKLASRTLESFTMIWLSPECRILTAANAMNVTKGCTNGRLIMDKRNTMGPETQEKKKEELKQCLEAVENQMRALEEENETIRFALENPDTSDLWDIPGVVGRIRKKKLGWRVIRVDQCAYGRKCKKPTKILTNMRTWEPKGITGTGRCVHLKCGGTKGNKPGTGQGRHEQQMIAYDPARKPREGERTGRGNRREYSVRAGKNLVQADLVQEIVRAAIVEEAEWRTK